MMSWYFIQSEQQDIKHFGEALDAREDNRALFLQMVTLYTIGVVACPYDVWKTNLRPIFMGQIESYYR